MRVLLLCLRFPFPPADGGTIAMYNMAMALHQSGATVKIAALNTKKHFTDPAKVPGWFTETFKPEAVFLDASVTPWGAFANLFSSESYNISRFDSPQFHFLIRQILEENSYDIVQLESLFVAPYIETIRKYSKAKIVFRAHNAEHIIWQRLCQSVTQPLKRKYLEFLTGRLKKYERESLKKVDALVTLTGDDLAVFENMGWKGKSLVSPIGIDTNLYVTDNNIQTGDIFHLGAMDWQPNIEGVNWFLNDIFPLIRTKFKGLRVHLAGKGMPGNIFKMQDDYLLVYGKIDDAREFMRNKQIMLVPLLSGGGMRVKIIEGLAMGKIIISTTIGAEGIAYSDGKNLLIADTPGQFLGKIEKVLTDEKYAGKVSDEAKRLAREKYDNKVLGAAMIDFYNSFQHVTVL